MMFTANRSVPSLLLLALACTLLISGCKTGSTKPFAQQTEAPEVRCQQPLTGPLPTACKSDDWVRSDKGRAQLSECAVTWIAGLLATLTDERNYRRVEHKCLDDHAARGDIRQ